MASNASKQNKRRRDAGLFRLFFLPFLLIGIVLLCLAVWKVTEHLQAQAWQPVQATLLERGVEREKSASGSERIGGTARLSGAFSYQWQGKRYKSDRLSFSTARTRSMGMDPDDWDARLDALLGAPGGTFTAWVNPSAPGDAVALRDLRWLEMGALIGFGLPLVWLTTALMFGADPHRSTAAFSWRTVGVMWLVGLMLAVLCPLLWRDGHPVWAALAACPLMLALYGTVHGVRLPPN
jgi:hypothetical protein